MQGSGKLSGLIFLSCFFSLLFFFFSFLFFYFFLLSNQLLFFCPNLVLDVALFTPSSMVYEENPCGISSSRRSSARSLCIPLSSSWVVIRSPKRHKKEEEASSSPILEGISPSTTRTPSSRPSSHSHYQTIRSLLVTPSQFVPRRT
ncbi:hypothetical protein IE53DRAFT_91005 [Violaceomyces palustris]|uniref:Uncharacterized protein n=1 Tax=Violaceomyces palustris TaxID=1673888 RepID=A0ACD0NXI4_9BASI|nr:hypothetical protein IE53DRAFT_91005 [Violaceomyces palustris]